MLAYYGIREHFAKEMRFPHLHSEERGGGGGGGGGGVRRLYDEARKKIGTFDATLVVD